MSTSEKPPKHPDEFDCPIWDYEANRPVVDGKFNDPKTGEVRIDTGAGYLGPPAVDLIITNIHGDSDFKIYRSQRPFPVETILCHIMRIVGDRSLKIDSVNATPYAIRVVLAHPLDVEAFDEVTDQMSNGIWNQV
ncbi:hypothetical protein NQ176_g2085 [Zarea fungicola]|uniref:Uncharacterized protein n=1 Tax=Zarea fungicola TaxID=93591 RepID=A0ACC1NR62_9HYPO|nr:hypothetical protein NQ176_g2085 [Lecanicillium fungicola]